jgi:predicted PurR-regulated permease PerM
MELEMDRSRVAWGIVGLLLAATVVYVLHSFVGTFVFGLFIYYATRPVYHRAQRRIRSPSLAAGTALTVVVLPVLLLLAYTFAIALQELSRLQQTVDFGRRICRTAPRANLTLDALPLCGPAI